MVCQAAKTVATKIMGTTCPATCVLLSDAAACLRQAGCKWQDGNEELGTERSCYSADSSLTTAVWVGVVLSLLGDVLIKCASQTLSHCEHSLDLCSQGPILSFDHLMDPES